MSNNKNKLPAFLKTYFWDVNFEKIDYKKSEYYVANRLLDREDVKALRWLFKNIHRENLINVVKTSRGFFLLSVNFWYIYFELDRSGIRCLEKSYLKVRKSHWPY